LAGSQGDPNLGRDKSPDERCKKMLQCSHRTGTTAGKIYDQGKEAKRKQDGDIEALMIKRKRWGDRQ